MNLRERKFTNLVGGGGFCMKRTSRGKRKKLTIIIKAGISMPFAVLSKAHCDRITTNPFYVHLNENKEILVRIFFFIFYF